MEANVDSIYLAARHLTVSTIDGFDVFPPPSPWLRWQRGGYSFLFGTRSLHLWGNGLDRQKLGQGIAHTLLTFARSALGSLLGNNNCLTALYVLISHSY